MQSRIRFSVALLIALFCSASLIAADGAAERYTFVVPNAPESTIDGKDRLTLTLNRWSTDAERDRVLETVKERGTANLLDAFRETGAIGYLRWPGGLEYSVRYAHRVERPDRGADVVLVVDRPLWVWWDTAGTSDAVAGTAGTASGTATGTTGSAQAASTADARYTVIQLRLNADGAGEGRIASGSSVASDPRSGVLVSDYAGRATLLNDVRREG